MSNLFFGFFHFFPNIEQSRSASTIFTFFRICFHSIIWYNRNIIIILYMIRSLNHLKELKIGKNDAGQRLDRFIAKSLPLLPASLLQKYIRLKRIKVNGKGSKRDVRLAEGDLLPAIHQRRIFRSAKRRECISDDCQPKCRHRL